MRWRWLLLLPFAVALVAAASASRLQMYWWPDELHEETTGRQGEAVQISDEWRDDKGADHRRELTVTLVDVNPATTVETFSGPAALQPADDTAVWEIVLRFDADPEVPLGGCHVALVDSRERVSDADGGTVAGQLLPYPSCEPEGRTGPLYDGTRIEGDKPRPASYEVSVYAVTSATVDPAGVRVWWESPDFVELSLADR